ncbi:MAG: class I SAM-dependent methyltransferase, partial [Anaerolineales bacterium]
RVELDNFVLYDFVERCGASVPAGSRLLDAGAGDGRFQAEFAHTRYTGVDLAVGDVATDYSGLDAICTLTGLPFSSAAFDAALCTQVLEHVPEPLQVLQEIYRVLRPGGRLFLSAPQSWHQHQKPHDYFRYTSFGLRYLFQRAGFVVESIEPMGGYFWFLAFQLQNMNFWLFPRDMPGRRWTWPLRVFNAVVFQVLASLVLFYLDHFDRVKDETFGYVCVAAKPAGAEDPS